MPPVGGTDYPRSYAEFRSWFPDDEACLDYVDWLRWPSGWSCPACGCGVWLGAEQRPPRVRELRPADIGDRGDDLPPHPDAADGVVRRRLADDQPEARHL